MFPRESDPSGGTSLSPVLPFPLFNIVLDPETWTKAEMQRWLAAVSYHYFFETQCGMGRDGEEC